MAIKNSQPIRYTPRGLADAFDASDVFLGAFQRGENLLFDKSNPELMVPRPGVGLIARLGDFGFANPGFISINVAIGTRIYGMVATTRFINQDEPFCIDLATGAAVPIAGVVIGNVPTSPPTTGPWTPPTMASVGVYLVVTHPGFNGIGANFFGLINLTNPALPVWSSANTITNPLTAVPKAVANFNNRAYFAVDNQVQYSDVLLPTTRTNASQALTIGDSTPVVALAGLPVQTTSSGVLSALVAWKESQLWQITGDTVTSNLSLNFISLVVGTNAPRSIAPSTLGIYFSSTAGPYFIDPLGGLHPLTQKLDNSNPDVQSPFINALTPSRMAGSYTSSIYRVCMQTVVNAQVVTNDYWFDEHRRRWNGPHTFPYDCASPLGGYFVLSSAFNPGLLIRSDPAPSLTSVYTDLGTPYNVVLQTASFPKTGEMFMKQVAESMIDLGGQPLGTTYTITAQDSQGNPLAPAVSINVPGAGVLLWGGGAKWGTAGVWAGAQNLAPKTYPIPWEYPLVFEKMQLEIGAVASANVQIGTFFARYQKTGYMLLEAQ